MLTRAAQAAVFLAGVAAPAYAAAAGSPSGCPARLRAPLLAEVDRLERALPSGGLPEIFKDEVPRARALLPRVRSAAAAGRVHLALARLADVGPGAAALAFAVERSGRLRDLAGFEAEWKAAAAAIEADERWPAGCGALRAVGEAALTRARIHYHAARGMSVASGIESGLYYLGEALGHRSFAGFVARLPGGQEDSAPAALGARLERLQRDALDAYARPGAEVDQHPAFIQLNATLKEARELDGGRAAFGAYYAYLNAVERLGMLGASGAAPAVAALRASAAALQPRLGRLRREHGIARVFRERLDEALDAPEADEPARRRAEAVVQRVLPLYLQEVSE